MVKAFAIEELGEPGSVVELAVPEPGEGQVRIRVTAAGLNPFDNTVLQGYLKDHMEHRFPMVPGMDASGTVDAVGEGVTDLAAGDEVFGSVGKMYLGWVLALILSVLKFYSGHRWLGDRAPMTVLEQLRDTTTIPGGPWTELWAPLGLRYHALHHLFPAMPYHSLGVAHRRLMRELPPDSPYHATIRSSLFGVLRELVQSARRSRAIGH